MRVKYVILLLVLLMCGCAMLNDAISAYDLCRQNSDCVSKVLSSQLTTKELVKNGISTGYSDIIAGLVSAVVGVVTGVIYGKKLKNKAV